MWRVKCIVVLDNYNKKNILSRVKEYGKSGTIFMWSIGMPVNNQNCNVKGKLRRFWATISSKLIEC